MTERDIEIAIRTIMLEGRGEGMDGQIAIAHNLLNRVSSDEFPDSLAEVCLEPKQYEGWAPRSLLGDSNLAEVMQVGTGEMPYVRAAAALYGSLTVFPDPTKGSLWYKAIGAPEGWHERMLSEGTLEHTVDIGNHRFFRRMA